MTNRLTAEQLEKQWNENDRWKGVERTYRAEDVIRLQGSVHIEHSLARKTAEKLWHLLHDGDNFVTALGAVTGNQAIQMARAGLKSIYLSGWQVAADANSGCNIYPDQSIYPADSAPTLARRINNAFIRTDQIHHLEGDDSTDWFLPIVADAEAGFGGVLNAYELMRGMIEAGAAGVHFEDQLASAKKCGHMGGKVLVPVREAEQKLCAARLAADVCGVPTVLVARTDADAANLLTSDIDERDKVFCTGERTGEGYFRIRNGIDSCISRGLAYAKYADLLWCESSRPDLSLAKKFSEGIKRKYPDQMLAYNCSPSFNWKSNLDDATIKKFQVELNAMGYKYQFITLAGFHSLNYGSFDLARQFKNCGMEAYVDLQEKEFQAAQHGYTAVRHQREVGASYFDEITKIISGSASSLTALTSSTEEEQFE